MQKRVSFSNRSVLYSLDGDGLRLMIVKCKAGLGKMEIRDHENVLLQHK
jgi:hypothetical protein